VEPLARPLRENGFVLIIAAKLALEFPSTIVLHIPKQLFNQYMSDVEWLMFR